jgi:hypothetical protein
LVRPRGADYIFDYKSSTVIAGIQKAAGGDLRHILDFMDEGVSPEFCYKAIGPSGGNYSTFLFPQQGDRKIIQASMVMACNAYGSDFHKLGMDFAAGAETYLFASIFCAFTEGLLAQGRFKLHPVTLGERGWEGISAGLDLMRSGAVSGTKLVLMVYMPLGHTSATDFPALCNFLLNMLVHITSPSFPHRLTGSSH